MPPTGTSNVPAKTKPVRQRKQHRKSRLGCGNCKLRSVKCDETKPSCKRCAASGFSCNYPGSAAPSLQLAHNGAFKIDLTSLGSSLYNTVRPVVPIALPMVDRIGEYVLLDEDLSALERYKHRTALSMGTRSTRHMFTSSTYGLASRNPFLLHIYIVLALIEDTHLSATPASPKHRSLLAFHWYHASVLFHRKLAAGVRALPSADRDAMWTGAALLGAAAFSNLETEVPEKSWPYAMPHELDLDWLKMGEGKKAVWDEVDPLRPGSAFAGLIEEFLKFPPPDGRTPVVQNVMPPAFYTVFNVTPSSDSTPETNPYHIPACILTHIIRDTLNEDTIHRFLSFNSQLTAQHHALLRAKDPRMCVLLAWWYAKSCAAHQFWLRRRAVVEGRSICMYVRRECPGDAEMLSLLEYPEVTFASVREGRGLAPGENLLEKWREVQTAEPQLRFIQELV